MNAEIKPANPQAEIGKPTVTATIKAADISATAKEQVLNVQFGTETVSIKANPSVVREYVGADMYEGNYAVTPTQTAITLVTHGKTMAQDVVVAPVPSNYGLITWNGAFLTVS